MKDNGKKKNNQYVNTADNSISKNIQNKSGKHDSVKNESAEHKKWKDPDPTKEPDLDEPMAQEEEFDSEVERGTGKMNRNESEETGKGMGRNSRKSDEEREKELVPEINAETEQQSGRGNKKRQGKVESNVSVEEAETADISSEE